MKLVHDIISIHVVNQIEADRMNTTTVYTMPSEKWPVLLFDWLGELSWTVVRLYMLTVIYMLTTIMASQPEVVLLNWDV